MNYEKIKAYLNTLTKPKIIELCLKYIDDKNIAEQQLLEWQESSIKYEQTLNKELAEKDKEISKLKTNCQQVKELKGEK